MADTVDNSEDSPYDQDAFDDELEGDNSDFENDPVARILKKLQSNGAVVSKSRIKYPCKTCGIEFETIVEQHDHLKHHVSSPNLKLRRLDEYEDDDATDDGEWTSDSEKNKEEDFKFKPMPHLTSSISKLIVRGPGINPTADKSNSGISIASLKSSGILSIKKVSGNSPDISEDVNAKIEVPGPLKKMETSGTLKMTIKHSSDNKLFEVINGAKEVIKSERSFVSDEENEENPDEWRPEDTKEGILNELLKKSIKAEPEVESQDSIAKVSGTIENVKIKSEVGSRPQTPNNTNVLNKANPASSKSSEVSKEITVPKPMIIPKVESDASAIIEINCDSDKDDDEIIFIGSSVTEKKDPTSNDSSKPQTLGSANSNILQSALSLSADSSTKSVTTSDKNHDFNWNTPVISNESVESLSDKNTDALFASLLSNNRKERETDLGISEYISLDKLGPQHNCDVCHIRFTSLQLLETHRKNSGHSNQIVQSNKSMALSTYQQSGFLVNSLLPVQQLADTVSKITSSNAQTSGAFTHQQNIMVNIQSFPGGMNQTPMGPQPHGPPPPYNYPGMSQIPHPYPSRYNMPNPNNPYPNQLHGGSYPPGYQYPPQPPVTNFNPFTSQLISQQPYPHNQYHPHNHSGQIIAPGSNHLSGPGQNQPMTSSNLSQPVVVSSPQMNSSQQIGSNLNMLQGNKIIPNAGGSSTSSNPIPMPNAEQTEQSVGSFEQNKSIQNGIKIQGIQTTNGSVTKPVGPRLMAPKSSMINIRGNARGGIRPMRPSIRGPIKMASQAIRGMRPPMRGQLKRPYPAGNTQQSPVKKRMDMLLPDKHDNEECEVVSMQQHREGFPLIQSIKGANVNPPVQLNSQITWKKTVVKSPSPSTSKDTNAMASILAARGIKVTPKQKPAFEMPNFGSGISVTPAKSTSSSFSIPEEDSPCSLCNKTFSSNRALGVHMSQCHPNFKMFRCENCPISYPTFSQLVEHKKVFHNTPNAEMGLPVVDLSNHSTVKKLNSLGISHFIPLANREQGVGCFGVPILSVQNALNSNNYSLVGIGSDGVLSLGPIKSLPK